MPRTGHIRATDVHLKKNNIRPVFALSSTSFWGFFDFSKAYGKRIGLNPTTSRIFDVKVVGSSGAWGEEHVSPRCLSGSWWIGPRSIKQLGFNPIAQ